MKMFQAGNIREIVQHCMAQQRLADLDFLADAETLGKFLDFFVKNSGGTYDRTQEEHYERAYSLDEIKKFIKNSGMKFEAAYDAFTFEPVREDSERIYVVAREVLKKEK